MDAVILTKKNANKNLENKIKWRKQDKIDSNINQIELVGWINQNNFYSDLVFLTQALRKNMSNKN